MIRSAGNTQIPTLWVIENIYGYKTYCADDNEQLEWLAEKEDSCFSANSPEELLGLIVMFSQLGDNWRTIGDMDILDAVMSREVPLWAK